MPTVNKNSWYRNSNCWAWIITGISVLGIIVLVADEAIHERREQARPPKTQTWDDYFTPEAQRKMGLGIRIEGPGDRIPPTDTKERWRKFLEDGGTRDDILDQLLDTDYHDLLDQMGGPEGF